MTGYVRVDTGNNIADGNVISAADLDNEFDGIQAAFNASTGHNHDGTTGEGAPILVLGPTQDVVVGASTVTPKTTNTVDIGSSSLKFKDLYMAGNASIGGTLGVTGATTLSAALTYGGVTLSNAVTGTGNMVLSASPTLTGTLSGVNASLSGTLAVTGVATLTAQPILSSLTASRAVFTDGSKGLVSNAITGTGNVVMSASPTLTGTITAEALTTSSTVTLNGGTANGVAYLNGSKVLTTGSALTFDGSTLSTTGIMSADGEFQTSGGRIALYRAAGASYIDYAAGQNLVWRTVTSIGGAGPSEQMRLTSTGLGIGTSSPQRKLHVNATPGATYGDVARFESNGSAGPVTLSFGDSGTSSALPTIGGNGNSLVFGTGAATKMTLDLSGNLGLGVTPSAWSGAVRGLQVGYGASFAGHTSVDIGYFGANWYFDGSANRYIHSAFASRQIADGNSGGFAWQIAPSGTAGNAISFTQAMTLDASGNLLVGTTSAQGRLTVRQDSTTGSPLFIVNAAVSGKFASFEGNGSIQGSITWSGSTTAYNTSSDYRLKNITGPITNSGAYIDSLNPVEGTWKADGSTFVGLIAHEAQEASRTQVATGVKDGEEMQGMDYSSAEIIANLIAEVKSLRKRLAAAGI